MVKDLYRYIWRVSARDQVLVAFISGLSRMNDPWGDLVDFFRNLTNTGLKYRMIAEQLDKSGGSR